MIDSYQLTLSSTHLRQLVITALIYGKEQFNILLKISSVIRLSVTGEVKL